MALCDLVFEWLYHKKSSDASDDELAKRFGFLLLAMGFLVLVCLPCSLLFGAAFASPYGHLRGKPRFSPSSYRREMINLPTPNGSKFQDEGAAGGGKMGSFKIQDGNVVGAGTYEVKAGVVDLDIKMKIDTSSGGQNGGGGGAPGGGPGTQAPPTTEAPGGKPSEGPGGKPSAEGPGAKPTEGPGEGGAEGSEMQKKALEMHNKFRKVHEAPPMTLDAEMSKAAEAYANKIANMGSMRHASSEERDDDGENLSMGCSTKEAQKPEQAVENWYNEVCSPGYTFGGKGGGGTSHFTQVVWKESVKLGFGGAMVERNGMKCAYYVGRYKVAGNMGGEYDKNVKKGTFDKSYCDNVSNDFKKRNFVAN